MLAMQYELPLPADYDMGVIRRRVAERGHRLDAFPGLGLKAYLIRERTEAGGRNQYAPFYLWNYLTAAGSFFWGGEGFGGIVASFGRPPVLSWHGIDCRRGPAYGQTGTHATRDTGTLAEDVDPQAAVAALTTETIALASEPDIVIAALAVDPRTWQWMRFALRTAPPAPSTAICWEVLHLSIPELDQMAR